MVIRSKSARGATTGREAWKRLTMTVAAAAVLQGLCVGAARADDADSDPNAVERVEITGLKARRAAAGRSTFEYGLYVSRRTQANDVPADYLPVATPRPLPGLP